ncbi:hypothetical protein [Jiangella asiatica]|uniref:DUF4367 domain-containing protein n=1 Tax=Jiangella asiatica TaxID=2530372 RepID=A0A4R5CM39_9ACTN|nr:hypothetical protein [Jiangella asiatica]TDE01046.1 hypothetical protein E1269_23985 [Jiangella asiatica]
MNDSMDAQVRRTARMSDERIAALVGSTAEADLMGRILATSPANVRELVDEPGLAPAPSSGRGRLRPTRRRLVSLAVAASVGAAALFTVQAVQQDEGGQVWAAYAVEVAEGAPRLLVDDEDWSVEYANEFEPDRGSMDFTDGTHELWVTWSSTWDLELILNDRRDVAVDEETVTVAGQEGTLLTYPDDEYAVIWQHGDNVVEALTLGGVEESTYRDLIASIHTVDVDTWLSALPQDVVRPADTQAVLAELLADIPLPDGYEITPPAGAVTRHQLVHNVEREAVCAWVTEWVRAADAGDQAAVDVAATALGGARDWAVQDEVEHRDEEFWANIDSIVDDGVLPGGRELVISGDTEVEGWQVVFCV